MLRLQTNDMKRRPNIGVAALIACASSEDPKRVNGKEGATANFTRPWGKAAAVRHGQRQVTRGLVWATIYRETERSPAMHT
jgi:hypothetical protein